MSNEPTYENLEQRVNELDQEDINRKRTEDVLRRDRVKSQQCLDITGVMFVAIDVEQNVTMVNKEGCEILGYEEHEIVGKNWFNHFIKTEDIEETKRVFDQTISGTIEPVEYYENSIYRKNGAERIIAWHNSIIRDQSGRINGTLSSGEDITERKQAENELRREKEFIETALNAQLDTFFLFEPATGKALRWNQSFKSISGYSDEDIARMPAPDTYYSTEDLERAGVFTREVLKEGTGTIELELICKNGRKVPTEYKVSVIKDERGEPKYIISIGRDITERKWAEEEKQRALKKLQGLESIINGSPAMVFLWPIQEGWPVEFVSDNVKQVLGYLADDFLLGKISWTEITHHEDLLRLEAEIAKNVEEGVTEFSQEYRLIVKSGDIRWMRDRSKVIVDLNGHASHIQSIVQDVTEQKLAEKALWESEERFRTLMQKIQAAVVVHRADTSIEMINFTATGLLGLTEDQLMGKTSIDPVWKFFREDGSIMLSEEYPVNQVLANKKPLRDFTSGIYRHSTKDIVWILVNADPIFDDQSRLLQVIVTFMDITARKRAEEALRESEELQKACLNATTDGVFLTDTNGNFLTVNNIASQALGKTPDELIGTNAFDYFSSDIAKFRKEQSDRVIRSGKSIRFLDEREGRFFDTSIYPTFDSHGKVNRLAVFVTDITERKRAEQERERLISELQEAILKVKTLSGLLPICSTCKKIRDDKGYWNQIEAYIRDHSEADFSHGLCPECQVKLYGDEEWFKKKRK